MGVKTFIEYLILTKLLKMNKQNIYQCCFKYECL